MSERVMFGNVFGEAHGGPSVSYDPGPLWEPRPRPLFDPEPDNDDGRTPKPSVPESVCGLGFIALVVFLIIQFSSDRDGAGGSGTEILALTPSTILARGYLRCGVRSQVGLAQLNYQGVWEGFEVDLCRGVAAGIFGKERFSSDRRSILAIDDLVMRESNKSPRR